MAKLTAVEIQQAVELNNGISTSVALTGLTGLNFKILSFIQELVFSIGVNDHWRAFEKDGTITLVTGTTEYTIPTDLNQVDKYSFRFNNSKNLDWKTPQEIDHLYPNQTGTGSPKAVYEWKGNYNLVNAADAGSNGKTVKYRYWELPTLLSTSSVDTSWFPEGFERTVLINWATYKTMQYRNIAEFKEYKRKVFGDVNAGEIGSLNDMRRIHGSPDSSQVRVTANF